ncbi:MAG: PAS domain-containing protein [Alphaproteobacteria bacterium]|nr:PAS domain-containing protein [Alphaproteobacteria bacterium]
MLESVAFAESLIEQAVAALSAGDEGLWAALDTIPAPLYVTDADGVVRYFNPACVDFAGRTPVVGQDRWCVTWKLYTEAGDALPHDQCPMAKAIVEQQPVRNVVAVAERPDGNRVTFMPYPTPLFGPDGSFRGAVNMLIDVTERRQADSLRAQAERCRRLARSVGDSRTNEALQLLADEYEDKASRLDSSFN